MNDLDLWYSYRSCTHLVDCIYQLWHHKTTIVSEISIVLPFSPYKNKMDQNWHCRKIGQGQPRVIIWTNLIWFEHPMLHTKFQGHRPFGSGKKDFFKIFIIYWHGGHLGHVTCTVWTNFQSPISRRLHMKFDLNRPSGFRGEDAWKC